MFTICEFNKVEDLKETNHSTWVYGLISPIDSIWTNGEDIQKGKLGIKEFFVRYVKLCWNRINREISVFQQIVSYEPIHDSTADGGAVENPHVYDCNMHRIEERRSHLHLYRL